MLWAYLAIYDKDLINIFVTLYKDLCAGTRLILILLFTMTVSMVSYLDSKCMIEQF